MAVLLVSAAGAALGSYFGLGIAALGLSGAAVGWTIGGIVGQALFAEKQSFSGPRLSDLRTTGTEYGQVIPWVAGSPRIAGQIIWASNKRETATTQEAGKGGGGAEYTTYSYDVDLLILLTENQIAGVSRIWKNSELVYGNGETKSGIWNRLTVYTGADAQLPDPTYEAAVGVGNAPAYRGMGSVFIEGLQLGNSGQIPNLTFEVGLSGQVTVPINAVTDHLMNRTGYNRADFDVTDLNLEEKLLRALAIGQLSPTRSVLEQLQAAYFIDVNSSDKVYFKSRNTSSVVTIPYEDLALGDGKEEPLSLNTTNELEVPAQIAVSFANVNADYSVGTEYSDRLLSSQETLSNVQLALGLTPTEGKRIANAMLTDQMATLTGTTIKVPIKYSYLEPNDVITVMNEDGSRGYKLKVVAKKDTLGQLELGCVLAENSVIEFETTTDDQDQSIQTPATIANTLWKSLDIPLLRDADDGYGYYVAISRGQGDEWAGGVYTRSWDDISYSQVSYSNQSAVIGEAITVLGNFAEGNVFDEYNIARVSVNGQLSSVTREALFNDATVNTALIGSEIIRFRTATLVSAGVYDLSGLIRGQRGTEWAMTTHLVNEKFVLLTSTTLTKISGQLSYLGVPSYTKAVTAGLLLSSVTPELFTDTGIILKPFSPVNLRVLKQSNNDLSITWTRRTRLNVTYFGNTGGSYPLGESLEKYRVKVYNGSNALIRTEDVNSNSFVYTTAMQSADGLTSGNSYSIEIMQISDRVGEGYATQYQGVI